jgi:hypothetical protein
MPAHSVGNAWTWMVIDRTCVGQPGTRAWGGAAATSDGKLPTSRSTLTSTPPRIDFIGTSVPVTENVVRCKAVVRRLENLPSLKCA